MSKRSSCRPRVHLGSAPMRWVTSGAQGLLHGLEVGAHLAHQRRDLRGGLARGRRDDFPEGVAGRPRAERDGLTGGVGLRAHTLAAALAGVDLGDGARRRRRAAEARHELVRVAQRPGDAEEDHAGGQQAARRPVGVLVEPGHDRFEPVSGRRLERVLLRVDGLGEAALPGGVARPAARGVRGDHFVLFATGPATGHRHHDHDDDHQGDGAAHDAEDEPGVGLLRRPVRRRRAIARLARLLPVRVVSLRLGLPIGGLLAVSGLLAAIATATLVARLAVPALSAAVSGLLTISRLLTVAGLLTVSGLLAAIATTALPTLAVAALIAVPALASLAIPALTGLAVPALPTLAVSVLVAVSGLLTTVVLAVAGLLTIIR